MKPPIPDNEAARLEALRQYRLLDTTPERAFDNIARLASFICGTPIALISLVDEGRQWFKAKVGLESSETHRDHAFCAYTILQSSLMVVEDALLDKRFAENPLVTSEPHIRFYAGAPLITPGGHALGALCVMDRQPHKMSSGQKTALKALAGLVIDEMELRRVSSGLAEAHTKIQTLSAGQHFEKISGTKVSNDAGGRPAFGDGGALP
jgi:hypothetical protein